MRVYQNVLAMNARRNLSSTQTAVGKSLERLATGLRINRAADDAAGLAISEKIRGQVRGLGRASANAQDAISMIQTAEGALTETHSILQRMRELAVQSSNGTLTSGDREQIQLEVDQLITEVDRIADNTEFNTKKLLDGTATAVVTTNDLETRAYVTGDVGKGGNFRLEKEVVSVGQQQILKTKQWIVEEEIDLLGNVVAANTVDDGISLAGNQIQDSFSVSQPSGSVLNLNMTNETFTIEANEDTASTTSVSLSSFDATGATGYRIYGNVASSTYLERTSYDGGATFMSYSTSTTYSVSIDGSTVSVSGLSASATLNDVVTALNGQLTTAEVSLNDSNTGLKVTSLDGTSVTVSVTGQNADSQTFFRAVGVVDSAYADMSTGADLSVSGGTISYVNVVTSGANSGSLFRGAVRSDINDTNIDLAIASGARLDDTETATFNSTTRTYVNADSQHQLGEISAFTDANGVSLFSERTITMRGNNNTTSFTISSSDTVQDMADKIFSAIETGLDMGKYWVGGSKDPALVNINSAANPGESDHWDDPDNDGLDPDGNTASLFELPGTMYISSAMVGELGDISFSAEEPILNAFGITEVQSSINPLYDITVTNLHTGAEVNSVRTSEYRVANLVPGLTVEYDPMADIMLDPDPSTTAGQQTDETIAMLADEAPGFRANPDEEFEYIHVAPTGVDFHIGANEGQVLEARISELSTGALGISNINLTNQSSAEAAISDLDSAINTVSSERARLGAYQNRLEHTINNLGVAQENLAAAESRIRDLDYAKEMIDFTRNQILSQAGTAMLAQANAMPQSVLQIIG